MKSFLVCGLCALLFISSAVLFEKLKRKEIRKSNRKKILNNKPFVRSAFAASFNVIAFASGTVLQIAKTALSIKN